MVFKKKVLVTQSFTEQAQSFTEFYNTRALFNSVVLGISSVKVLHFLIITTFDTPPEYEVISIFKPDFLPCQPYSSREHLGELRIEISFKTGLLSTN